MRHLQGTRIHRDTHLVFRPIRIHVAERTYDDRIVARVALAVSSERIGQREGSGSVRFHILFGRPVGVLIVLLAKVHLDAHGVKVAIDGNGKRLAILLLDARLIDRRRYANSDDGARTRLLRQNLQSLCRAILAARHAEFDAAVAGIAKLVSTARFSVLHRYFFIYCELVIRAHFDRQLISILRIGNAQRECDRTINLDLGHRHREAENIGRIFRRFHLRVPAGAGIAIA